MWQEATAPRGKRHSQTPIFETGTRPRRIEYLERSLIRAHLAGFELEQGLVTRTENNPYRISLRALRSSAPTPGGTPLTMAFSSIFQKFSALSSGSFGEGRVHRATKQRRPCRQFLHSLHSRPGEELAESFKADRIWSPSIRLGSFILHNQKAIRHRQKPPQKYLLLLNEVQRVFREDSIDR